MDVRNIAATNFIDRYFYVDVENNHIHILPLGLPQRRSGPFLVDPDNRILMRSSLIGISKKSITNLQKEYNPEILLYFFRTFYLISRKHFGVTDAFFGILYQRVRYLLERLYGIFVCYFTKKSCSSPNLWGFFLFIVKCCEKKNEKSKKFQKNSNLFCA